MRFMGGGLLGLWLLGCDDKGTAFVDGDGDGVSASVDCDDADAAISPGAPEVCDGIDNDCDGLTDEDPTDGVRLYVDFDGDGFGSAIFSSLFCTPPAAGYVEDSTDCDDLHAMAYPGGIEVCDGVDNDCDGTADSNARNAPDWYPDADGDGYGAADAAPVASCTPPAALGYTDNADDCDDSDAAVSPDVRWYPDRDGDGYGSPFVSRTSCTPLGGHVADASDCDDEDAAVRPDAQEVCDGADNDCDGAVDDEDASLDTATAQVWYADADGDDYGDPDASVLACAAPEGYISDAQDCDDAEKTASPALEEQCGDGIDNDCDGVVDSPCLYGSGDAGVTIAGDQGYATSSYPYFGHRAAAADISGDGVDDLLLTAYSYDVSTSTSGEGAVFAFFGPLSAGAELDAADAASLRLVGAGSGDVLGFSMSGAGDLDGDGYADLAVGAYGADYGGTSSGRVYVFLGPLTAGLDATAAVADVTVDGESAADYLGWYLVDAADIDGDGQDELIVGSTGDDTAGVSAGRVMGFDLSATSTTALEFDDAKLVISGGSSYATAGYSFAAVGDVDGDGDGDFLHGEPGDGMAYLLAGPLTASALDAGDALLTINDAAYAGNACGERVAGGDINGDGYADLLVSTPEDDTYATDAGIVSLWYGPLSGTTTLALADAVIGTTTTSGYLEIADATGALVATDVDGDGLVDVLIGEEDVSDFAAAGGGVLGFYGPLTGTLTLTTDFNLAFLGEKDEYLGRTTALGDLNNDGDDTDVIVTSIELNGDAGAVFVFFGGDY